MPVQKLNIPLPSKGLVVDRPAEYVDSRSQSSVKNMELTRSVIRKRVGTMAMGSTLSERVMRYFELEVGAVLKLFRVGITDVQEYDQGADTWSTVANAALTGSAADPVDYAFPVLSGERIAVFTNGIDNIRKIGITGNDADLGGTPPKAKYCQAFGSYVFLANITNDGSGNAFPNRVQWSDTGDPETWTGGNSGSKELLDDSEFITGINLFSNYLVIHKPSSIYVGQLVSTSDVIVFDRKSTGVGTVAGATIVNLPSGEQIFLASDGIHVFNGITAPLIDSPIQDELRESMNAEHLNKCQGVYVEELDEYHVSIPIGSETEPSTVYRYNMRTKQVFKNMMPELTAMGLYTNTQQLRWSDFAVPWSSVSIRWNSRVAQSLSPLLIYGDSSGNSTKRSTTVNNDSGVAIDAQFETKEFTANDFGVSNIDTTMRWTGLELWAKGNNVDISYSTDGGTSFTNIGTVSLDSDYPTDASPLEVYFDFFSSGAIFRFRNNTLGETFHVKKYQIKAIIREERK